MLNPRLIAIFGLTSCATLGIIACHGETPRFPLRAPLVRDTDLASVSVQCRVEPTDKNPRHVSCAPTPYESSLYWDGADNLVFRPLSDGLGISTSGESIDVNSLDEVPDSSWFTNRIGVRPMGIEELRLGGCAHDQILDPEHAADGSWIIDKGKDEGSSSGFRMKVPGHGKYLVKTEDISVSQETQAAASVVGIAIFHALGYFTPCEQILYVRPSLFKLTPGLRSRANFADWKPFDQAALDRIFAKSTKRGALIRVSASAWVPGYSLGPARFVATREDDPNDVIRHEDRRELRGMRLADAWFDRWDAREENSLDSWFSDRGKAAPPDSSPGHVIHYQLDTSESLGGKGAWEAISQRLGYSYMIDWGDIGRDFITLGIATRPWDTVRRVPGHERFGFMDVAHFDPEAWKPEYANAAFSRMTERDGAWMARILAHFNRAHVRALAELGDFSDPRETDYLAGVLEGRLERVLERYLLKRSPLANVAVEDHDALCAVDLAAWRGLRQESAFGYSVSTSRGPVPAVEVHRGGKVCVRLVHTAAASGGPDNSPERYLRVTITNGVAKGPLVAHLVDLGARGFVLVGLERPE